MAEIVIAAKVSSSIAAKVAELLVVPVGKHLCYPFKKLEQIVLMESRQVHKNEQISKIEFTQLRTLTLQWLPCLTRFGFNALTPDMRLQEILAEDDLDSFIPFFSQNVELPRLEKLKLCSINIECRWLDQLPAVSSSCQTLAKLIVEECNEEESIINMMFPKLNFLLLGGLPKLTGFGSGNSIQFPSLDALVILDCPRLKMFFSGSTCANITVSKEQEATSSCADIYPLLDKKLMEAVIVEEEKGSSVQLFPNLQDLTLRNLPKLARFYYFDRNLIDPRSLSEQRSMNCPDMETFISKTICANMTGSEECSGMDSKENLHANIQPLFDEKNLHSISVQFCDSLKSLFPASVARGLVQLEELSIGRCMMEEITAEDDGEEVEAVQFWFPQLTTLKLWKLSRLKSFYTGSYVSEWPVLKMLEVLSCNEVEILASQVLSHGESRHEIPTGQPLFLVGKDAFPSLECLAVDWNCFQKEMLHGKFSEYLCKLNYLALLGPFKESAICPSCFLHKLPNLETLSVYNGFINELLLCDGLGLESNCPYFTNPRDYVHRVGRTARGGRVDLNANFLSYADGSCQVRKGHFNIYQQDIVDVLDKQLLEGMGQAGFSYASLCCQWDNPHVIPADMTLELSELFSRELTRYIEETEELAMNALKYNRHILDIIAKELLEKSRITGLEVEEKLKGLSPVMFEDYVKPFQINLLEEGPLPHNDRVRYQPLDIYPAPLHRSYMFPKFHHLELLAHNFVMVASVTANEELGKDVCSVVKASSHIVTITGQTEDRDVYLQL
ncbi:hypothetical protein QYF36_012822 [Acer negundo]|nr:hypothetical protein QYF36_012822 [Acer negundo]